MQTRLLRFFLCVLLIACATAPTFGQEEEKNDDYWRYKPDSKNIAEYPYDFTFKFFFDFVYSGFYINSKDENVSTPVSFLPNVNLLNPGVGASYKWLGGSFVYSVPGTNVREDTFGSTEYFDLQLNFNFNHFGADLFYQDYQGFFLLNHSLHDETERKRPDLSYTSIGANAYFSFSRDFSMKAAFQQSERQLKSAGSFIVVLSINHITIDNSDVILPAARRADYPELADVKSGRFISVTVGPGYGHTVRRGPWSYTGVFLFALGGQQQAYTAAGEDTTKFAPSLKGNIKGNVTYDMHTYFLGAQTWLDVLGIGFGNSNLILGGGELQFFSGMRL